MDLRAIPKMSSFAVTPHFVGSLQKNIKGSCCTRASNVSLLLRRLIVFKITLGRILRAGQEVIIPLCSAFVNLLENCVQFQAPSARLDVLKSISGRAVKMMKGQITSPMRGGSESWACSAWRRRGSGGSHPSV